MWAKQKSGFTIVELLIVIVIIAILAAITYVTYSGIQNRAKQSSAQSAARQAYAKIHSHATLNSDNYPAALADVGITNTSDTTFAYQVNNSASPRTFCVTVTNGTNNYYVSHSVTKPTSGSCP